MRKTTLSLPGVVMGGGGHYAPPTLGRVKRIISLKKTFEKTLVKL